MARKRAKRQPDVVTGPDIDRIRGVVDDVVGHLADVLPSDQACLRAAYAIVARLAMIVHHGDVAPAQGLINGLCEAAKLEALNLADGGRA